MHCIQNNETYRFRYTRRDHFCLRFPLTDTQQVPRYNHARMSNEYVYLSEFDVHRFNSKPYARRIADSLVSSSKQTTVLDAFTYF